MNNQAYCKACKAVITWQQTKSGKFMPLDPNGVPHWATCPDAKKFKK